MTTVQSVQLANFRGFREHTVTLDPVSILVGQNNAGKSTFIDALRLLSVAMRKLSTAQFQSVPEWLRGTTNGFGYRSSFETVDFSFENTQHNYDRHNPAKLQIVFHNRVRFTLWLGAEAGDNFAQISNPAIGPAPTRRDAVNFETCPIVVMPPVGPLFERETVISRERVREFMFGRLAHRHFRNQLNELVPQYRIWRELLEDTWPRLKVDSFITNGGDSGKELALILREGPFASEAAWVGSGLQAWMQILWFICRADRNSFVVLDEPDIYLHADMQRKVAKLVINGGFRQSAIATHSAEIIADVDPSSITVIRKRERYSWRPGKRAQLQTVVDGLGSGHNLQLSKLAAARKIVLYEGDDQKILSDISLKIGSESYQRFSLIPSFDIKGIDNWKQAIGAAKALHVSSNGEVPVYLVIDRDYRIDSEIEELRDQCLNNHLSLCAWSRKEIENYFVEETIIHKVVCTKVARVEFDAVVQEIECSAAALKDYTLGAIADQWQLENRRASASAAMKAAHERLDELCQTRPLRNIVSGKRLISELSARTRERWGVSFGPMTLCRTAALDQFDKEIVDLVRMLVA